MNIYLKGNWNIIKGKLKQKYSQLTDDDLVYSEGREDELTGKLQKKLGKTKAELIKEIDSLIEGQKEGEKQGNS